MDVLAEPVTGWAYVRSADGRTGYAASAYLARVTYVSAGEAQEQPQETQADLEPYTTIRREDGATIRLAGRWAVLED